MDRGGRNTMGIGGGGGGAVGETRDDAVDRGHIMGNLFTFGI